ncbi:MAG: glycosyltransferase family 1 protein [Hyphomicrobiaceae bacterium]|nr:glycosyltransferase family 1 protein [Hyphomicrobiaceae bacterium]
MRNGGKNIKRSSIHIALITDAWEPQVNGVVHSLGQICQILREKGDRITVIHPGLFRTVPCPTYAEIRLALTTPGRVGRMIEDAAPDVVHISTEGPLGRNARHHCLKCGRGFTTSYHTRFPEYVNARFPVPIDWLYAIVRRFHNDGLGCMVATASLRDELSARGFNNLMHWPRGVDPLQFKPIERKACRFRRPVFLNVGRVAVEKNIEAFASLDVPGTKVVVGDGPALQDLKVAFPDVKFLGHKSNAALSRAYAEADVFVFPSLTDTFGNVLLEAMASGLPVAAYPVTGPKDVILDPKAGVLDTDLRRAALAALKLKPEDARAYALTYDWENSARLFRENILRANGLAGTS